MQLSQKQADDLTEAVTDLRDIGKETKEKFKKLELLETGIDQVGDRLRKLEKLNIARHATSAKGPNDLVSPECARFLGAIAILSGEVQGKLRGLENHDALVSEARSVFGMGAGIESRSTLTTTDVPMPTSYGTEVVELVYKYGQARQYGTVYPCGPGTNKLPRLKTSPAFGFIDIASAVPEKSPQVEYVDFNPYKAGGIVRIPSEIDADNLVALGQFIARYFARELAKWEDQVAFNGDGTATYKSISGVGKSADTLGKKIQLGATLTAPSDMKLADLRTLRGKIDASALQSAAYYCHPSHESGFVRFNTLSNGQVYMANSPGGMSTLDGFPIRPVGVMPVYDQDAHAGQYQILFGDLSYYYMGVRGTPDLAVSRDVFFATDEIAMRGLERFDWKCMADASMAVLQLANA